MIAVAVALTAALAALAGRADLTRGVAPVATALDVLVGVAFIGAAASSRGVVPVRLVIAATGATWLLASALPQLGALHQALLLVALALATRSLPGLALGAVVAAAAAVATGRLDQWVVGLVFITLALLAFSRRTPSARTVGAVTMALGGYLVLAWWTSRRLIGWFDPGNALIVYEVLLIGVALSFAAAGRIPARHEPLTRQLLGDVDRPGLAGLVDVLGRVLGDPTLRVRVVDDAAAIVAPGPGETRRLLVRDAGVAVAVVEHTTTALDDSGTADAVAEAVRLTLAHDRLVTQQRGQLRELEAARARILAAADRQRSLAAQSLRGGVATLREARDLVVGEQEYGEPPRGPLDVAGDELDAAVEEILGLVAGVPTTELGQGRLAPALLQMAARSPVSTSVRVDLAGDVATETVVYFVAAEALTNAVKHAAATHVRIVVRREHDTAVVSVTDDGLGGARVNGRGLRGLADRVAANGGRLRVESPPGAGTRIEARVPLSPLGSTA